MLLKLSTYELLGKVDCTVRLDLLDAFEAAWETEVGRGAVTHYLVNFDAIRSAESCYRLQ
jgi:hypothetical protein